VDKIHRDTSFEEKMKGWRLFGVARTISSKQCEHDEQHDVAENAVTGAESCFGRDTV
jgi:hypothetical protein